MTDHCTETLPDTFAALLADKDRLEEQLARVTAEQKHLRATHARQQEELGRTEEALAEVHCEQKRLCGQLRDVLVRMTQLPRE